jgi:Fe-S oxidoreductase
MKIEFMHDWQRAHGLALRERMVAHLPRWAPRAASMPRWANLRDTLPGARTLGEKWLGISARRSLPRWRRDAFMERSPPVTTHEDDVDVVLFVDTFTNYFEPDNARAAVAVLRAGGYRIRIARAVPEDSEPTRPLCCGRTYLGAGLVDDAKREARRMVAALAPHVARGTPIVGLEPSCLLTLRDEYLVMGFGDAARRLAENAYLIEEFLAREHSAGRLHLPLNPLPQKRALLHGHCHQKAFDAVSPALAVLKQVPGLAVDLIESSCCGMAGSFGYEAEHYDISMRMAEQSLLPAVRAAAPEPIIVADGTTCRHKLEDGARF